MKRLLNYFIAVIDALVVELSGWSHIPGSEAKYLYLVPHRYRGRSITLRDGTQIIKNDIVAELHIDNKNIKFLEFTYSNLINALKAELGFLKRALDREPYSKIKAVHSMTVFHAIAQRQGFTAIEIANPFRRIFGSLWENLLRLVLKKGSRLTRIKFVVAKDCWLSKSQIEKMEIEKLE